LLEAAACGLPLVATDDGGPCDILRRCGNGALVDVTDLDALQHALEAAAADPGRWRLWRDNGVEAVSRNYSWDAHVGAYLGLAQRCCPVVERRRTVQPLRRPTKVFFASRRGTPVAAQSGGACS